jgi:hypothetical protein
MVMNLQVPEDVGKYTTQLAASQLHGVSALSWPTSLAQDHAASLVKVPHCPVHQSINEPSESPSLSRPPVP